MSVIHRVKKSAVVESFITNGGVGKALGIIFAFAIVFSAFFMSAVLHDDRHDAGSSSIVESGW